MTGRMIARVLLLLALVVTPLTAPTATPAGAATTGTVIGYTVKPNGARLGKIQAQLFDGNWSYLRQVRAKSGRFQFRDLAPGVYYLQVTDLRPRYDISAYATQNARLVVQSGRTTSKIIRMRRGGFITGRVVTPKGRAAGARIVATPKGAGPTYEVNADGQGQFAIGGLPRGGYSLWAWDKRKTWAGKSTWVGGIKVGKGKHNRVLRLNTRAGGLNGIVLAGGNPTRDTGYATAVNKKTGQWYTFPIRAGSFSVRGLYPGRYRVTLPGMFNNGNAGYLGGDVVPRGKVRPGRTLNRTLHLNSRGGWVTGTVKGQDGDAQDLLGGATVSLYDRYGSLWHRVKTASNGTFRIGGTTPAQGLMTIVVELYGESGGRTYRARVVRSNITLSNGRASAQGTIVLKPQPKPAPSPTSTPTGTATPTPTASPSSPTATATTSSPTTAPPSPTVTATP